VANCQLGEEICYSSRMGETGGRPALRGRSGPAGSNKAARWDGKRQAAWCSASNERWRAHGGAAGAAASSAAGGRLPAAGPAGPPPRRVRVGGAPIMMPVVDWGCQGPGVGGSPAPWGRARPPGGGKSGSGRQTRGGRASAGRARGAAVGVSAGRLSSWTDCAAVYLRKNRAPCDGRRRICDLFS